jgi:hypothetical protein
MIRGYRGPIADANISSKTSFARSLRGRPDSTRRPWGRWEIHLTRLSSCIPALITATGLFFDGGMNPVSALPDAGLNACYDWCGYHRRGTQLWQCWDNCTKYYAPKKVEQLEPNRGSTGPTHPPVTKPPPLKGTNAPLKPVGPDRIKSPVAVSNQGDSQPTGGAIESGGPHHGKNKR